MINVNVTKQELIKKLAKNYQLELLILFGSQITGRIHRESDFDIGYISRLQLTSEDEGHLIIALMPIVEQQDERVINLVNLKRVTPLLLFAATKSAQIFYEHTPITFAALRAYSFKQYFETKSLYRIKAERLGIKLS
ncbi:MAG: nucleotidyltransferase domain-containing protein [Patescibacteria group bacterium]